jgi:S-adenosylmethionine synthetase
MDLEIKQYLDNRFADVDRRTEAIVDKLAARIAKVETSLLSAFVGWTRPMETRINNLTSTNLGFDERLDVVERLVSELERSRVA